MRQAPGIRVGTEGHASGAVGAGHAPVAIADVLIDAPPGVSCPAISAVIESDVIVLVTEPTPFGVFDLSLAYSAFKALKKPMGVVINRAGVGDDKVYQFCQEASLPVWAEIPYKRSIAEAYANGEIIAESSAKMRLLFNELSETIQQVAHQTGEVNYA